MNAWLLKHLAAKVKRSICERRWRERDNFAVFSANSTIKNSLYCGLHECVWACSRLKTGKNDALTNRSFRVRLVAQSYKEQLRAPKAREESVSHVTVIPPKAPVQAFCCDKMRYNAAVWQCVRVTLSRMHVFRRTSQHKVNRGVRERRRRERENFGHFSSNATKNWRNMTLFSSVNQSHKSKSKSLLVSSRIKVTNQSRYRRTHKSKS